MPDQDVIWSREPEGLGTITQGGIYTAPIEEDKVGKEVTIKATSAADPAKSVRISFKLKKKAKAQLSIDPLSVKLELGQEKQFKVVPVQSVKWSYEPKIATLDEGKGVYKAPPVNEEDKVAKEVIITPTTTDAKTATAKVMLVKQINPQ